MKRTFALLFFLTLIAVTASAQDYVSPPRHETYVNTESGFITMNEIHFGFGLGSTDTPYSKSFFGFTTVNGYQFTKRTIAGIGVGLSFYNEKLLVPLFLDFRYRTGDGPLAPYFFADGGLLLNFPDLPSTKIFINPGLGLIYNFNNNLAGDLGAGLLVQSGGGRDSFINFKLGLTYLF